MAKLTPTLERLLRRLAGHGHYLHVGTDGRCTLRRTGERLAVCSVRLPSLLALEARGYVVQTTVIPTGGCPQAGAWDISQKGRLRAAMLDRALETRRLAGHNAYVKERDGI